MSKSSKKLAVKKETLRQLDARQLEHVHGGAAYEWVILKHPTSISGGCTTELFALNNYDWYRY
jgi:hypothetical protein